VPAGVAYVAEEHFVLVKQALAYMALRYHVCHRKYDCRDNYRGAAQLRGTLGSMFEERGLELVNVLRSRGRN